MHEVDKALLSMRGLYKYQYSEKTQLESTSTLHESIYYCDIKIIVETESDSS